LVISIAESATCATLSKSMTSGVKKSLTTGVDFVRQIVFNPISLRGADALRARQGGNTPDRREASAGQPDEGRFFAPARSERGGRHGRVLWLFDKMN
jgi:hypothetical protein